MDLSVQYFLLVFIGVLGAIQACAARAGLRGLIFTLWFDAWLHSKWPNLKLNYTHLSYILALVTILPVAIVFFTWNEHSEVGIIEGSQQSGLFMLATLVGGVFTLLLSSLTNHWQLQGFNTQSKGLEALKENTWVQIIWRRWVRKESHER
ncbi:MAG: hypothetical protein FWH42_04490 [Dehalococcoidia bacterium]|nr:hypothetical protein [Dehalococcoidia bacterium]